MLRRDIITEDIEPQISCSGYCSLCKKEHYLYEGDARRHCVELMQTLERKQRIDLMSPNDEADPRFSTDYLFGKARGQMFGVMVCEDKDGSKVMLRAFSGQYNGVWEVDGWVAPLLNANEFDLISCDIDKKIKGLGKQIDLLDKGSSKRLQLIKERRALSKRLMKDIHSLYQLNNFKQDTGSLFEVFYNDNGIPTGTGDCCAPKLLNYAAQNNLTPLSVAEFYYGRENRSGTRLHGQFYPSCEEKCQPILGFMLCGLDW